MVTVVIAEAGSGFVNNNLITLAFVICIFAGPGIAYITKEALAAWERVQKHRENAALKHRLIEAGMTADEIIRVVECGSRKKSKKAESPKQVDDEADQPVPV